MTYEATFSPEDNKLRLKVDVWLDSDEWQRLKDAGFRSAPKQAANEGYEGLFFVSWSPGREDLCIELAGDIEPEDVTLAERAELKAERLDGYQANRLKDSEAYHRAASAISERFAMGQPILVGHHSERSARRDQKRMHSAMDKAVKANETANYWSWRAEGVERHANQHHNARTRANRIKKILAELRDMQRTINQGWRNLVTWEKIAKKADSDDFQKIVEHYAGNHETAPWEIVHDGEKYSPWSALRDGDLQPMDVVNACLEHYQWRTENPNYLRWIQHYLNRLRYEREEQGGVSRFEGELTPVLIQTFAREQGAEKPKATKNELMGTYTLHAVMPLPIQIDPTGDMRSGGNLELTHDDWRDLMQQLGHTPVIKEKREGKKQTCSLINPTPEEAEKLQAIWNADAEATKYGKPSECREVEQKYYSANSKGDYSHFSTITLDQHGRKIWHSYRDVHGNRSTENPAIPTCRVRVSGGAAMYGADCVVVVTDKPQKALPTFEAKPVKEAA